MLFCNFLFLAFSSHLFTYYYKYRLPLKGAGLEPIGFVYWFVEKLPKLKIQLSSRKLIASSREMLSNVFLNLFLSSLHVLLNFVAGINCFSPPLKQKLISSRIMFFSLLCGIYICKFKQRSHKLLLKVLCFWH